MTHAERMSPDEAKRVLLDVASYAFFRKGEVSPMDSERVEKAIEVVWRDTFGEDMTWVDRAGMHMPHVVPEEFKNKGYEGFGTGDERESGAS
jgi:hypothetical protein